MSDVIGAAVIEVRTDASGVSAEIAAVAQSYQGLGQALGNAIGKGADQAATATDKLSKSQERLLTSIEKEAVSLSSTRSEYRAFEAQLKGISESVYGPYIRKLEEASTAQARFATDQSFQRKVADAAQLAKASDYVRFWETALEKAEAQEKEFAATEAFNRKATEAAKLNQASEYVRMYSSLLDQAEHQEKEFAATEAFNRKAADAAKLNQASEYVRFWEEALEKAEIQERKFANDQAFLTGLQRKADAMSKLPSEIAAAEAAQRGLTAQAAPFIATLRAQETAYQQATKQVNAYGMSQKATSAALRGVPAQLTDIVVSLQGGQAPITVLLQQGGQLKDMFGGVVPAARALGTTVLGYLVNPFVLAAGAVAGLTYAYYLGSKEQSEYVKALALTGNQAGVTAGQLATSARAISAATGATRGAAAEALTSLVNTGQVSGTSDLERFAKTQLAAQKFLALSVQDTAKAYAELGKDPVAASKRLNESMGYLTTQEYAHIQALVDSNRATEAAVVAQHAYDEAIKNAASQAAGNLGYIERAVNALSGAFKGLLSSIADIGRDDTLEQKVAKAGSEIARLRALQGSGFGETGGGAATGRPNNAGVDQRADQIQANLNADSRRQLRAIDNAQDAARNAQIQKEGIDARDRIKQLSNEAKGIDATTVALKKFHDEVDALRRANPKDEFLDPKNIAAIEAQIRNSKKAPAGPKAKAFQDDEATKYLLRLREIEASLDAQLDTENKLTEQQKDRAKFEQLILDLKNKGGTLTNDQKSLLANEAILKAQLDTNAAKSVQVQINAQLAKDAAKAQALAEAYEKSIERIRIAMESAAEARTEAIDKAFTGFGSGDSKRQELEDQRQLNREFARYQDAVKKASVERGNKSLTESDLKEIDGIKARRAAALAENAAYYQQLKAMQADWSNGASRALENYYDDSQKVADQINEAFTHAFQGLEDALVTFVTTGKLSFTSLANSIVADIDRIIIKSQITGPLANMLQGQMGASGGGTGFGGYLNKLFGGIFGGGGNSYTGFGGATGGFDTLGFAGTYASGGWVPGNKYAQVNENGPELLTMGNKTMLMTGSQGGKVTPVNQGRGGGNTYVLNPPANMDRRAQRQFLADAAQQLDSARTART